MSDFDVLGVPGDVLDEQRAYYDARASEYDDWFFRRGRYDRGHEATAAWFDEIAVVRADLEPIGFNGLATLEFAPGTGLWTQWLDRLGADLTVVDASSAMLGELRHRLGSRAKAVKFIEADLFSWSPPAQFDRSFFGFWISHVPKSQLESFFKLLAEALVTGGKFGFIDSLREQSSTASDHVLPSDGDEIMIRRLDDGSEFRIVKNFYEREELVAAARAAGLELEVLTTEHYFVYGTGTKL